MNESDNPEPGPDAADRTEPDVRPEVCPYCGGKLLKLGDADHPDRRGNLPPEQLGVDGERRYCCKYQRDAAIAQAAADAAAIEGIGRK